MDISNLALVQTLTNQLITQTNNIAQLQGQLSSGHVLNQPSDNPTAVTQVLALSSQTSQLNSWQTNSDTATAWLGIANSTSNSVLSAMQSAQTLLLQAANQGSQNSTTYKAMGTQLQGIVSNLLSLANTQYEGRGIFAGTSASSQAYDVSGNYLGNSDVPTTVIGPGAGVGRTVALAVPGTAMFGTAGSNVFSVLTAAATALLSGSPSAASISTALSGLASNISTAQTASAKLGEAYQDVATVTANLTSQLANLQSSQANLQDVNVAVVSTQLQNETLNYQAAIWVAQQSIPNTLLKFLVP